MLTLSRRALLPCLLLLVFCSIVFGEDVKLREEAVRLLERANQVSLPGTVPNYEQVVTFRVHYLDGTTKDGTYSRVAAGANGYREEESLGDYHAVSVRSGDRMSSTKGWTEPPEFRELRAHLPVLLGRFDHEDVIRSIEETTLQGHAAKCIHFDTHFGATLQHNQLCVENDRGVLLHWQVGEEVVDNEEYFAVGSLWEPAHMVRSLRGVPRMEIDQKITVSEGPADPNLFTPPTAHWNKLFQCRTWRRAIGIATPQPAPGTRGTGTVDIIVTGIILETGKTTALKIQSSSRPDLEAEAIATVSQWTFQPMLCDDKTAASGEDFVVHFQGR